MKKSDKDLEIILDLWECSVNGKFAETNPEGWTFCRYQCGEKCPYQFGEEEEKNLEPYCSRWHK
jgi:hypothetical protein